MAYDDLLTVGEVIQSSLSSSSAVEDEPGVVQSSIQDVQGMIESYLRQPVMIHKRTQGVLAHEWMSDELPDDHRWRIWAEARPVVEIDSPSEVSIRYDNEQLVRDQAENGTIDYFAGWKRSDQALSNLPTGSNEALDGLTTEPPTLPQDIRKAAIKLVLFDMGELVHDTGFTETTTNTPGGTMTIRGPEQGFEDRQLSNLSTYRRPAF